MRRCAASSGCASALSSGLSPPAVCTGSDVVGELVLGAAGALDVGVAV